MGGHPFRLPLDPPLPYRYEAQDKRRIKARKTELLFDKNCTRDLEGPWIYFSMDMEVNAGAHYQMVIGCPCRTVYGLWKSILIYCKSPYTIPYVISFLIRGILGSNVVYYAKRKQAGK